MAKFFLLLGLAAFHSEAVHETVFFLKHSPEQVARLFQELEWRSDPASDLYGEWLSREAVNDILRPEERHLRAVRAYLTAANATWEELGDKVVAWLPGPDLPSLPALSLHVDLVSKAGPGFQFARRRTTSRRGVVEGGAPSCLAQQVDPNCLRQAYGISGSATTSTGQAVIVNQGFKPSDLSAFQQAFAQPAQSVAQIVGHNDGSAGDEASLDLQYIMTTGRGVPTTYVWLDGSMDNPFTNWLVWAAKEPDASIPKVHSLSLGASEAEVGDTLIQRMNTEMAALTLRGVTILFASGDAGYQANQKYGAASPYVLAVGGVFNGDLGDQPLRADDITTGGFAASKFNKAGKWQQAAIQHYLTKTSGDRPPSIDASQRAVPDLSAYDSDFQIFQDGSQTPIGGTSAACPVVAGMLASINDALVAAGHKTLGFVNPFLYANADAFLDVTAGDNHGIAAVEGYDPVSGLGTFNETTFATLRKRALASAAVVKARRRQRALVV